MSERASEDESAIVATKASVEVRVMVPVEVLHRGPCGDTVVVSQSMVRLDIVPVRCPGRLARTLSVGGGRDLQGIGRSSPT
jgi:hypothetical protein